MTEVARADIRVDLNDAEAIAGLRAVDAEFDRVMRDIDRSKATYKIEGNIRDLERKYAEAQKLADDYEKKVNAQENKSAKTRMARRLEEMRGEERAHKARIAAARDELKAQRTSNKEIAAEERLRAAAARAAERQSRQVQKNLREEQRLRDRAEANERRMLKLHSDAMAMERKRNYEALTGASKEAAAVQRLQSRYAKLEQSLARISREQSKFRTLASRDIKQRLDISQADAVAEMTAIRAELTAMGAKPIVQHIDVEMDERHANQLSKALESLSDTAIRIGPITTSIAGLARGLALLGPIIVGVAGQIGALIGLLGAGLGGAVGIGAAALGAFGISLGGVGALMPSLLKDFKNLNQLQDAWHKEVLKGGDKVEEKWQQYQHALKTVPETTRRAFNALDKLKNSWNSFAHSRAIRSDFFGVLADGLETINHHMTWFQKNTTAAFDAVSKGWAAWMKGLRSDEAGRILKDLGQAGNESIRPLMGALGNLGTVFGRVAQSFARWLPDLLRGFEAWTGRMATATDDSGRLNNVVDDMVESMRDLGKFAMAAGRFLVALFAPSVDPASNMLERWTDGLNRTAESMRTVKREKIGEFFKDAIGTATRFWQALKPLVQVFFEWSTIMQPFTDVALIFARILGRILQTALGFGPTKGIMQAAFGLFLVAQFTQRARAFAGSIMLIARGIGAIKAAGGLGAAFKTGALSRLFNPFHGAGGVGQPGATPARPMFVKEVGVPGGVGRGPGGGPTVVGGGSKFLDILKAAPRFAKVGGAIVGVALAVNQLNHMFDKAAENKGMEKLDKRIQQLVANRNLSGLRDLKNEFIRLRRDGWGGLDDAEPHIDKAISGITKLENAIANSSIEANFRNLARSGAKSMDAIRNTVAINMQVIRSRLGTQSAEGKAAIAKNFRLAADAVKRRMDESGHHTREGARLIRSYMIRALTSLGLNRAQAEAKLDTGTINTQERTPGRAPRNAKGGLYTVGRKGQAGLDNVPMNLGGVPSVVANGEQIAVFNRHQQAKFARTYPGGLENFFSGPQKSHAFQGGGIVPVPGFPGERAASSILDEIAYVVRTFGLTLTDAYGPGHKSPGHTRFGTAADFAGPDAAMTRAAHALAAAGYIVGYDGTGGTRAWPGHGPSTVAGANAHLHVEFGSKGGAIQIEMPKIPNVTSQIPGAPGALVNRGLAIIHATAQETANRIATEIMSVPVAGGGGTGKGIAAAMLGRFGWGQDQFPPLDTLWTGESGWNPSATNPSSGAYGIPQALPGSKMASAGNDWRTNPATQIQWGLGYIKNRYGSPAAALRAWLSRSPHWYAPGGLVDRFMGPAEWKKGGKVAKPTLLTGEDGNDHPEFVVGTNPQFRKSNVAALQAAAKALGVPTARESKNHRGPKKFKDTGREVDRLPVVKHYAQLQQAEEDKNREISIAQQRVQEPDTLIKQVGTDKDGSPLYEVDQAAVDKYVGQMNDVNKLYEELIGKRGQGGIMKTLREVGTAATERLAVYRQERDNNIQQIQAAIEKDERLLKSKDKDVRKKAQARLEHNRAVLGEQRQKKQEAGQKRGEIQEDLHDANFRVQEYQIAKEDLGRDISAVSGRAAEEVASSNPEPPGPGAEDAGPSPNEIRAAQLDAELALAQIGQGLGGAPPRSEQEILTDQAALQQTLINEAQAMLTDADTTNDLEAYQQLSSAASALAGIQGELAKFNPMTNLKLFQAAAKEATREFGSNFIDMRPSTMATSAFASGLGRNGDLMTIGGMPGRRRFSVFGGGPSPAPGAAPWKGGGAGPVINNYFKTMPPDPHTWSKGVAFEIAGAL